MSKITQSLGFFGWSESCNEHYLYDGLEEIGAFTPDNTPKNIKILGRFLSPIALELEGKVYAPLMDLQGNIKGFVDGVSKKVTRYDYTAFGEGVEIQGYWDSYNPWRFAGKRLDPELKLIYFGKRYYDPGMGRWLTQDPAGFVDSMNLYQYVFNNPLRYADPNGEFAQLALPICASCGPIGWIVGAFVIAIALTVDWEKVGQDLGILDRSDRLPTTYNDQSLEKEDVEKKNKKKSPGNLQKQVEQEKAPDSVDRVDKGRGENEKYRRTTAGVN